MGKNTNKQYDLLVIGAGASGMMAAITAAREGRKVLLVEKLDKAGKKLLATGNGKCNFTNEKMSADCYGGERTFIEGVLSQFSVSDCLDFFHSIGIYPKNKNGYYYPNSEQASSVVTALAQEMDKLAVDVVYETIVTNITSKESTITLQTNKGQFFGNKLIVSTGLLAAPKLGSDGSMFELIKSFGHRFQPILPALCGFYCKGMQFKKVSGVRATGKVTALVDGEKQAEDTGEVQFTDYGLSGIPVFQISRYLSKGLYHKSDVKITINLLPEWEESEIIKELNHRKSIRGNQTASALLNGLLNQKLGDMIIEKINLDKDVFLSSITDADIKRIAVLIQNLTVSVTKYRDFEFAQVCTGGISPDEIDANTLESKLNMLHL